VAELVRGAVLLQLHYWGHANRRRLMHMKISDSQQPVNYGHRLDTGWKVPPKLLLHMSRD